jgi:cation transport ATPase
VGVGDPIRALSVLVVDVVILVDKVGRVAEAVAIAQRTQRIARQSIVVGLGLSGIAMMFAAFGLIPPVAGALLQEGIDVAVILNALRSLAGEPGRPAQAGLRSAD